MTESMIRVEDSILENLRKKFPELKELGNATLVEVALRKILKEVK